MIGRIKLSCQDTFTVIEGVPYSRLRDRSWQHSTQRCVHQDGGIKLCRGASDAHGCHLVEGSQWVTPREELCYVPLLQGAGDQHHHVVDHVAVAVATEEAESVKVRG